MAGSATGGAVTVSGTQPWGVSGTQPWGVNGTRSRGRSDIEAPRRFPDDRDTPLLFGLVTFEGPNRAASTVLVPFCSALAADRYATAHGLDDYVVAPLSFLAAR